ncbi:hypothetical protein HY256_10500 [Candidatus Sumerlaeota bacterium]|nr:hypothetical protein [Candidatus Sumerlaeota bacterium]
MISASSLLQSRSSLPLRLAIYLLLQALILGSYILLVESAAHQRLGEIELTDLLKEDRWLEWSQVGVLTLGIVLMLGAFRRGQPPLHTILALLPMLAVLRELDSFAEEYVFNDAHLVAMLLPAGGICWILWSARDNLRREIPAFVSRPGFFLMLMGSAFVILYAQLLGRRDIWKFLANPRMLSQSKRFIEEGLELMGYVVILCGLFEERFFGARPEAPSDRTETAA